MKGNALYDALSRKLAEGRKPLKRRDLADKLGVNPVTLWNWNKRGTTIKASQIATLVAKSKTKARQIELVLVVWTGGSGFKVYSGC